MATILDETAILRYLLKDNARQAQQVADIVSAGDAITYPEIITRVAVVLRDVYHVPRSMIARVLEWFVDDVYVPEKTAVALAVRYFGSTVMDFTDCMMLARNVLGGNRVLSFDKAFMKKALP